MANAKEVHNKTMNFTRFGYVDEFFMNTRFAEVTDLQSEYFKVGCSCGSWGNNGEMMEFDGGNTGRNKVLYGKASGYYLFIKKYTNNLLGDNIRSIKEAQVTRQWQIIIIIIIDYNG